MIFNLVAVAVVIAAVIHGVWKGLAWQLAGIFSLIAGFVVAIPLSKPLAPLFGSAAPLNRFIALAVLYLLISLGIYLLALAYRTTLERWKLQEWDRHLGGVMGGVKGYLICLTLTFFAITLASGLRDPLLGTAVGRLMGHTMMAVHPALPPEVHDILHPYIHGLDEPEPAASPAPSGAPSPSASPHHPP